MRLEIWWLMSAAKRASLRRRFFSNRRAELVFLACNRFRNRCLSFAVPVEPGAGGAIAVAGGGDVHDAQIHANKSIDRVGQRRFGRIDGGVQKPFAVAVDQVGLPDRAGAQQHQIPRGGQDPDTL